MADNPLVPFRRYTSPSAQKHLDSLWGKVPENAKRALDFLSGNTSVQFGRGPKFRDVTGEQGQHFADKPLGRTDSTKANRDVALKALQNDVRPRSLPGGQANVPATPVQEAVDEVEGKGPWAKPSTVVDSREAEQRMVPQDLRDFFGRMRAGMGRQPAPIATPIPARAQIARADAANMAARQNLPRYGAAPVVADIARLAAGARLPAHQWGFPDAPNAQRAVTALNPALAGKLERADQALAAIDAGRSPTGGIDRTGLGNRQRALAALTEKPQQQPTYKPFDNDLLDAVVSARKHAEDNVLAGTAGTGKATVGKGENAGREVTSVGPALKAAQERRLAERGETLEGNRARYEAGIKPDRPSLAERSRLVAERGRQAGAMNQYARGNPLAVMAELNRQSAPVANGMINPHQAMFEGGPAAYAAALDHNAKMAQTNAEAAAMNDPWRWAIQGAANSPESAQLIPMMIAARDRAKNGGGMGGQANVPDEDLLNPNKGEVHLKNGHMTQEGMDRLNEIANQTNLTGMWPDKWTWGSWHPSVALKELIQKRYPRLNPKDIDRWYETWSGGLKTPPGSGARQAG